MIFLVVIPSLVLFAATFGSATDLRSYGAQSVGSVLIACGMFLMRSRELSFSQRLSFAVSAGILGSLDVWATILAFYFFLVAFLVWKDSRSSLFVLGSIVSFPLILASYLPGPFSGLSLSDGVGTLREWVFGLGAGFSFQIWFAIPLFLIWIFSAMKGNKAVLLFFDLPALITIATAFLISFSIIPIYKWYVTAPVYALFAAGTTLRLLGMHKSKWMLGVLVAGVFSATLNPLNVPGDDAIWTSKGALGNKQNWAETTAYTKQLLTESADRTILTNTSVEILGFFLPDARLIPLPHLEVEAEKRLEEQGDLIVVLNHTSVSEQTRLEGLYGLDPLKTWPTGGVYQVAR